NGNLISKFDHCLTCMNCVANCPAGANPVKVITAARAELFARSEDTDMAKTAFRMLAEKSSFGIFSGLMAVATKVFSVLPAADILPFVRGGVKRVLPKFSFSSLRDGYPKVIRPKGGKKPVMRVGYFTGCMADRVYHDTGHAVIEVLRAAGAEVVISKDEVCCGAPSFFAGDRESATNAALKNMEAFDARELDYIVTSCATCGSVLKEIYPDLLQGRGRARRFSSKIIDFQELIADSLLDELEFIEPEGSLKVTYHDPCHLLRGMNVKEAPREILKKLPGVEFVEMDGACKCCGGSGLFSLKYYDDALEIGRRKAQNIAASGADVVVTACPSCRMQLSDVINRYNGEAGQTTEVTDVTHTAALIKSLLKAGG
ncbi:MAG: (Fe-S)-binding protein, partial [Nitrospinota bacterium]